MNILMTMFGWADAGGGTIFPRQIAHELARRGHRVHVLYSALEPLPGAGPYALRRHQDGAVQLLAVHNRPVPFVDDKAPAREVHDAAIARLFAPLLAELRPDVVHFHNFLGLSAAIAAATSEGGVPSLFTPYNFWAVCPTLYLTLPDLSVCGGVASDGANCLRCTKATQPGAAYVARTERLRELLTTHVGLCLPTSRSVHDVFVQNGYPASWLSVQRSGSARAERLWREVGAERRPGVAGPLRIGFLGSVLPIKGVHLLVAAAQALRGAFEVHVHGEAPPDYAQALRQLDPRGVVQWHGAYREAQLPAIVRGLDLGVVPSICLDHSPQVVDELQAARVPVLGARIGGIPDYVQQGAGELFAAGDAAALAVLLQRCIHEPARVVAWQQRLQAPPTFGAYVDRLEALYRERTRTPMAPLSNARPRRLNLGCGNDRRPGYWNVDKYAAAKPDEVVDLEQLPWPFADDSADEVVLHHVLEHLGHSSDTFLGILKELYRVCAPGGTVRITVPHPRHQDFLQDPTHVRPIVPELFLHTSLAVNDQWAQKGLPGTPLARYLGLDFTIVSVDQRLDPHWRQWLAQDPARQREIDAIARSNNNVVQEVEVVLRAEKPFRG